MYVFAHVYAKARTPAHTHIHTRARACADTCARTHICTAVSTHICVHRHLRRRILSAIPRLHTHACIPVYTHAHTHVCTQPPPPAVPPSPPSAACQDENKMVRRLVWHGRAHHTSFHGRLSLGAGVVWHGLSRRGGRRLLHESRVEQDGQAAMSPLMRRLPRGAPWHA